jgi:2-keto-4-pentenoate hydratase/2-oxohepta-3-ene-1,7-dioic acid hydratase in catechol pathway
LHYECELVLRVSKNGRYIQERNAGNYYNAITVGIDFTARDIQEICKKKGLPWEKAKSFDNSAVVGKWVDLTPEINKKNISFHFNKNGETVQKGNSENMIFSFNSIIAHVSKYFSINIGDLIFTGTPAGVGETIVGDKLEAFLEGSSLLQLEIK